MTLRIPLTALALALIAVLIARDPIAVTSWFPGNAAVHSLRQTPIGALSRPTSVAAKAGQARLNFAEPSPGLRANLERDLANADGTYGIAVIDLTSGSVTSVNGDRSFPTASLYKLLVMYRVFQAIENGDLLPSDRLTITDADTGGGPDPAGGFRPGDTPTVDQALDRMVTVSSNAAAYALARTAGGWGPVVSAARDLGMTDTVLTSDFFSTPLDIARFFHLLADQRLISASASQQMIDLLLDQTANDRIPALLPANATVAHKTGEQPEVRTDGGIVSCANGRYVIVLMSQGADPSTEVATEARLSRTVYEYYCA